MTVAASAAERQAWITMNDGVRLDATVCAPEGPAPAGGWPGLILVHGHGDTACKVSCLSRARRSAARGYLAVAYSVRGQGGSEGLSFHMGPREVYDLQDVVAWVLSAGDVHPERLAVAGSSQGGWHAWMAAIHCPQVATVVPENIFTDYAGFAVRDGCLNRWFFTRTMRRRIMTAGFQELARRWALEGEWDLLQEWLRPCSAQLFAERIRCPVFILHGWHDVGMPPNEVLALYERLRVPKKIYLGGGGHDAQDDESAQQLRAELVDRWLDHWLKGHDTGLLTEPPITCARRPSWQHAQPSAIPDPVGGQWQLFLRADGRLGEDAPTTSALPANINNFVSDPDYGLAEALRDDMDGVPSALAREEVVFESDALDADLDVLGAPVARLHVLGNRPQLQVHVELYDVPAEEGQPATLISRGHWGTRSAAPGQHRQVAIETATIHWRLAAGHRLRLVVANCNATYAYPYFESFCARLHADDERPSSLTVPLGSGDCGGGD